MRTAALVAATLMGASDGSAKNMQSSEQHPGGAATEVAPQEEKAEAEIVPPQNTGTFGTSPAEMALTDCLKNNTRLTMAQCVDQVMAGNQ